MKFLSTCSGIEAASVAWEPLGWEAVAFSEIEKFPSAVLAHHWPDVPNMGDMTQYNEWKLNQPIDLLVGGTPCQSFSVAGLRKGLQDPRGNLTLAFLAMAEKFKPRWVVWENVPGVLSDKTNAFGQFLAGLGELGYGFAYRVLDAQHFGVPQRRRRVFVVGCLGDWASAASVLFEPESLCGDLTPSRKAREEVAGTVTRRTCSSIGADDAANGHMIPVLSSGQANAERTYGVAPTLNCNRDGAPIAFLDGDSRVWLRVSFSMDCDGYDENTGEPGDICAICGLDYCNECACPGPTQDDMEYVEVDGVLYARPYQEAKSNMQVRRLTPTECERLQGFSDQHTLIPWRNKLAEECPDGPRYKALGNSMAVPVMAWIGQRIAGLHNVS